jgi:hypothetical protein
MAVTAEEVFDWYGSAVRSERRELLDLVDRAEAGIDDKVRSKGLSASIEDGRIVLEVPVPLRAADVAKLATSRGRIYELQRRYAAKGLIVELDPTTFYARLTLPERSSLEEEAPFPSLQLR